MTPRSTLLISALVLITFILVAGCQESKDPAGTLLGPPEEAVAALRGATGVDDVALHQALEAIWKNTDGVMTQVFTQTIDCQTGGVFTVRPVGWPAGYDVTLTVDPGTVPLNHDPVVEFVMEVPVTGPSATVHSVPYVFHPDGIRFNQPVHVAVAWPQWAGATPASGMHLWYLEQEVHDGAIHYLVVDRLAADPPAVANGPAKVAVAPVAQFSVAHFSRWNLADDQDGDDDPIASELGSPLAITVQGDCCWTDLAASPTQQLRSEF